VIAGAEPDSQPLERVLLHLTQPRRDAAVRALGGLLEEFRRGRIVAPSVEREAMERHAGQLTAWWNERFSGFPTKGFPYTSFWGEYHRGKRDAHLIDVIAQLLADREGSETAVVNVACAFGRQARRVAARVPHATVVASDIDPRWERMSRWLWKWRPPGNYTFVQDNTFAPRLRIRPTVVVFFGACGSLSDGAMDYAIDSGAEYVVCRTCCHDNIGGNVAVTTRSTYVNWFFRFKNWIHARLQRTPKYAGFYHSPRYPRTAYPRSAAGRELSDTEEFLRVAEDSPDSDICRAIIDLDRFLYLTEQGFRVEYQGESFVAER
jgi:hypothetical protein